jgi:hypothetical protein
MSMAFTRGVEALEAALPSSVELLSWRVFKMLHLGGQRLVAEGERSYQPSRDIIVTSIRGSAVIPRTVSLPLSHGFALALSVSAVRAPLDGFGVFISCPSNANGFSWNWFDRDRGHLFERRHGRGRLRAEIRRGPNYEQLTAVEFIEDVSLGYLDDVRKPLSTVSHEIVIGRGSVFKFGA